MKKILIVEDEERLASVYRDHFVALGYDVAVADDAKSALKKMKAAAPDVVLMDILLRGEIDGVAVVEKMKGSAKLKRIPVVMLTNMESGAEIARAFEAGSEHYLLKAKYSLEDVSRKVEDILKTL